MVAPVVVGIDGSEQALGAVRAAALQARHRGRPLRVVHAFIWPSLHVGVGPVAEDMPGTGLRNHAEDLLAEAAAEAGQVAPGVAVTTALVDGAATPVLLHESREAALLVLGDRGLGGVSGLIIGSVAVHASAHAHCPVLVVRGDEHPGGPVVVGVDGSEGSRLAVAAAFEQSALLGADLVAVLAGDDGPGGRLLLSEALAGWGERYPEVTVRAEAVRENARHVLIERSGTARLVVVGARGRDTFKGLVLGSVSQALLHHAACPVEVVRAVAAAPEPGEPSDNVDVFLDRPANAVSGLVPDRELLAELLDDLRASQVDVSGVVVLHGPEGVRILDSDGSGHGWHSRFVRFFQNWGYDDAILNLYDEGLRKGEVAFMIPAGPDERHEIARLARRRQGHAVHYFGPERAESLSGP
ncbi:Nucleotide-binding universal stress protein, UspA family [Paractinoplanes atraurantiacus]|uniref:Nucleotide-binding universal stress protein, UspA family n=1 Tax=Paractinoplanes atraurantiacus TaxID=1036182 RepID=A0A285I2X3_9ACTN|nr:Nucleotide-binding universal stress protein, UspA family [Actinoplanes atraurantiacus]